MLYITGTKNFARMYHQVHQICILASFWADRCIFKYDSSFNNTVNFALHCTWPKVGSVCHLWLHSILPKLKAANEYTNQWNCLKTLDRTRNTAILFLEYPVTCCIWWKPITMFYCVIHVPVSLKSNGGCERMTLEVWTAPELQLDILNVLHGGFHLWLCRLPTFLKDCMLFTWTRSPKLCFGDRVAVQNDFIF